MRSWMTVGLALCLTGCAARGFIHQGKVASARGDWINAHAGYARASQERPGSAKLAGLAEQARVAALAQYEGSFVQHRDRGDLAAAFQVLLDAYAIGPEAEWVLDGFDEVESRRNAAADAALASGDLEGAYQLALETLDWYPERSTVLQRVVDARTAMVNALRGAQASGAFRRAQLFAKRIAELEPGQQPLALALQQEVDAAWSHDARTRAEQASRRGRHGEAVVLGALVTTLSSQATDRTAFDQYRQRFLEREGLVFDVDIRGTDARARPIRQQLAAQVATTPGVAWMVDALAPTVQGSLQLAPPLCEQSRQIQPARHTYVAGVIQVPNPEHVRLSGLLDRLQREERDWDRALRAHEEVLAASRLDLEYAHADAVPIQRALVLQQRRLDEAIASQARAIQALEDAEAAAREVDHHDRRSRHLTQQLQQLEQQLVNDDRALLVAQQALATLASQAASPQADPAAKRTPEPGAEGSRPTRPEGGRPTRPEGSDSSRPDGSRPPRPTPGPTPEPAPEPSPEPAPEPSPEPVPSPAPAPPAESPALLAARLEVERSAAARQSTQTALTAARATLTALTPPSSLVRRLAAEVPQRAQALQQERRVEVEERYVRLEADLQAARQRIGRLGQIVGAHERDWDQLAGRLHGAVDEVDRTQATLAQTRPTVGQDVLATYDYEVELWTRSCTVRGELDARTEGLPAVRESFSFAYETSDAAFSAVPSVGLQGDPLSFPVSDASLIQRGDADLVAAVAPLLTEQIERWRQSVQSRVNPASSAEDRTRALVAAWLARPSEASPALEEHLRTTYELYDVGALIR